MVWKIFKDSEKIKVKLTASMKLPDNFSNSSLISLKDMNISITNAWNEIIEKNFFKILTAF